jgi:ADP-ribosyl-[dinitrogen reductase] hydrolase
MNASTAALPPLPLRNCYWVVPGLLLAGEHPGGPTRDKTKERLKKLLGAGIECFVDLTKPTELPRYDNLLPFYVEYTRKAIKDHAVPASREQMLEVLEAVGNALRAGRPVYVHCRAGIGRTGTVIGCLLVERGLSGDGALDELNRLWQQSKRSRTWAFIPETEAQTSYVREWQPGLDGGGLDFAAVAVRALAGPHAPLTAQAPPGAQAPTATHAMPGGRATPAAHAAVQNIAEPKSRNGGKAPGTTYLGGAGLSAAAAKARAAVESGEVVPATPVARHTNSSPGATLAPANGSPGAALAPEVVRAPTTPASPDLTAEPATESADPLLDPDTLAAARVLRERFVGALLGLAVGDALAAATQYRRPGSFTPIGDLLGGGPFDLPRGAWSDDTAMALCLAESLLECNGFDPRDQVQRYTRWQQEGYLSATGQCVGITASTARSLAMAQWRRVVFPGSHDPEQCDPEPISRIAPVALYYLASLETTLQQAAEASRTTCQAPAVLDACRQLGRSLHMALKGQPKARIAEGAPAAEGQASHTATAALATAIWAFSSTTNFRDAVLRAVNVGGNSDVVASVCGQLAGAHYGFSAIPQAWRNGLMHKDLIEAYADRLLAHALVVLSA